MPTFLSEHFSLEELVASQTATRRQIDNKPSPGIVLNLRRLCAVLEEVRALLGGVPLVISSGYRSPALNKAIGGAGTSKHMLGLAVDFTVPKFGTVLQTAKAIAASGIAYDQTIYEYGTWVHLGLAPSGQVPRRQNLSIFSGTGYIDGIVTRTRGLQTLQKP